MYKATLLFASGLFSGALATYILLVSVNPAVDLSPQFRQLTKAINSLETRTIELEIAMQTLPQSPSSATVRPRVPAQIMQDPQSADRNVGQVERPLSGGQNMASAEQTIEPDPSVEQIETYRSIEMQLSGASNDYSADLSGLIKQAEGLTNSQRNELTQKATQMINNGELRPDQFDAPAEM
jgi:hypothetical protein